MDILKKCGIVFNSFAEVVALLILGLLPVVACVVIHWIGENGDLLPAIQANIITGELLAYVISATSPIFLLVADANRTAYKLPWIKLITFIAIMIWGLASILYVIARLELYKNINMDIVEYSTNYFYFAAVLFLASIVTGVYIVYHTKKSNVQPSIQLRHEENDFIKNFGNRLNRESK